MEPDITLGRAQEIVAGKTAPKVTEETIRAKIADVAYLRPAVLDGTLTICVIVMQNGWVSVGKSAPVSAANFDPDVGKRYAYEDAFRPLWQLEGYLLREKLAFL